MPKITSKGKAVLGLFLTIFFVLTLVTGIILHLKAHGTIIEPRKAIKIAHWICGLIMVTLACWHGFQFMKSFKIQRKIRPWFWLDTWSTVLFLAAALVTGLVKLLAPIKIPHLGLWHYWLGLIASVASLVHLVRGIPTMCKLFKARLK